MHIKQTDPAFSDAPYDAIQTDGCFWRALLYASELFTSHELTAEELKRAYHYSIPDYMEDHRTDGKDRCYIQWGDGFKGHEEIMRIGFYVLGERSVDIEYAYRKDYTTGKFVIGKPADFYRCNFWIGKCRYGSTGHFYVSDMQGKLKWNPGNTYSADLLSLRGFRIKVR